MVAAKKTNKKNKGTVGIIGLGIMGGAFAKNLTRAGWRVVGYDISAARRREAARAGVEIARDAAGVAAAGPTVLTSLPKPQALIDTVRAIAAAKLPRKLLVEMSTFAISDKEKAARALAKAGHLMLDTPVSGTGSQAINRDLVFYASGDPRHIKRLRPMFQAFGRHVFDVGAFGNGSKIKYVANLLVAINNVATAEAMVLGMKAGLPPQLIFDLITPGAGNSNTRELPAPGVIRSKISCGGRPAFMPSTMASAVATLLMATSRLATYFILLPLPKAPTSKTWRPKAWNIGRSRLMWRGSPLA